MSADERKLGEQWAEPDPRRKGKWRVMEQSEPDPVLMQIDISTEEMATALADIHNVDVGIVP